MPKKANVSASRQLILDKLKVSQKKKEQHRLGFIDEDFPIFATSRMPTKAEKLGVARMVNTQAGGDARAGGPLVTFH